MTLLNGTTGGQGVDKLGEFEGETTPLNDQLHHHQALALAAVKKGAIQVRSLDENGNITKESTLHLHGGDEDEEEEEEEGGEEDSDVDLVDGNPDLDPRAIGVGRKIGRKYNLDVVVGNKVISVATASNPSSTVTTTNPVIAQMEVLAASAVPVFRHTSEQEARFLMDLKRKHGEDYSKMARDSKLNPTLLTVSQLRRKLERFDRDLEILNQE